nr:hypothetical protein LRH_08383 [Lacticaseibacillus rhamnosus HN001]
MMDVPLLLELLEPQAASTPASTIVVPATIVFLNFILVPPKMIELNIH